MKIEKYLNRPAYTLHDEYVYICRGCMAGASLIPFFSYHHELLLEANPNDEPKQYHEIIDFIRYGHYGKNTLRLGLDRLEEFNIISELENYYLFHPDVLEILFFNDYKIVKN